MVAAAGAAMDFSAVVGGSLDSDSVVMAVRFVADSVNVGLGSRMVVAVFQGRLFVGHSTVVYQGRPSSSASVHSTSFVCAWPVHCSSPGPDWAETFLVP